MSCSFQPFSSDATGLATGSANFPTLDWNPAQPQKRSTNKIPPKAWEDKKEFIRQLYLEEDKPLKTVREALESSFNFTPTVKQLRLQLEKWQFYKYGTLSRHPDRSHSDGSANDGESSTTICDGESQSISNTGEEITTGEKRAAATAETSSKRRKKNPSPSFSASIPSIVVDSTFANEPSRSHLTPSGNKSLDQDYEVLSQTMRATSITNIGDAVSLYTEEDPQPKRSCDTKEPQLSFSTLARDLDLQWNILTAGAVEAPVIIVGDLSSSDTVTPTTFAFSEDVPESPQTTTGYTDTKSLAVDHQNLESQNRVTEADCSGEETSCLAGKEIEYETPYLTYLEMRERWKMTADFFFQAYMFEEAFDLYYHCYLSEFKDSPRNDHIQRPTNWLIRLFTDMARSAVFPRTADLMEWECQNLPWTKLLSRRPWSLDSTALFKILGDLRFYQRTPSASCHFDAAMEHYKGTPWTAHACLPSSETNRSRFAAVYLNLRQISFNDVFQLNVLGTTTSLELLECRSNVNKLLPHIVHILAYFWQLFESLNASIVTVDIPGFSKQDAEKDNESDIGWILNYCSLSKAYEHLDSMTTDQLQEEDGAVQAQISFKWLRETCDIHPYAIFWQLASVVKHRAEHDWRGRPRKDFLSFTPFGRAVLWWNVFQDFQNLNTIKDEDFIKGFCLSILSFPAIAQHVDQKPTAFKEYQSTILRQNAPNKALCTDVKQLTVSDMQESQRETIFERPGHLTLLSDRSSRVSELSAFRNAGRVWSVRSGASWDEAARPTSGLNRNSLGI